MGRGDRWLHRASACAVSGRTDVLFTARSFDTAAAAVSTEAASHATVVCSSRGKRVRIVGGVDGGWQVLRCSFPFCCMYARLAQSEGKSATLGFGRSECPCPAHGGCASTKTAPICAPRKITPMLAKLFANDVRGTHVVEPCCKDRPLSRN
jgi:hypothetical protein